MVYDGLCSMTLNGSQSANTSDITVTGLLIVEGVSIGGATVLLLITALHLMFIKPDWGDTYQKIQINICSLLFITNFLIGIGFLVTPCEPLEFESPMDFVRACRTLSSVQFIFVAASFHWKAIEACFLCHLVAQFFAKETPRFFWFLLLSYIPAACLMALSFSSYQAVDTVFEGSLDKWMDHNGLDIYCWPGTRSKMVYFQAGGILFSTLATFYFFFEATSLVRDFKRGTFSPESKDPNFMQCQKLNYCELEKWIEAEVFNLRSSMMILVIMLSTWMIGTLQSVLAWGLAIPFGVLSLLEGLVYFLFYVVDIRNRCYVPNNNDLS